MYEKGEKMKKIAFIAILLGISSVNSIKSLDESCSACTLSLALNDSPPSSAPHREKISEITHEELKKKVDNPQFKGLVVNVLGRRFWEDAHIPRSISAPLKELDTICKSWNKDREIIVYCAARECDASYKAYKLLVSLGFTNVTAYEGGIREWFQTYGKKGTNGPCEYRFLKENADGKQIMAMRDCALKTILLEVYCGSRG